MNGGAVDIRPASVADAAAIALVHVRSWQAAYRGALPDQVLDHLDAVERYANWQRILSGQTQPEGTLLAKTASGVVGFTSFGPSRDPDPTGQTDTHKTDPDKTDPHETDPHNIDRRAAGEIYAIYLLPTVWGTGVGRSLLFAGAERLRAAGFRQAMLWVLTGNDRARRFYEAAGWHHDGSTKPHLTHGVALTVMRYRHDLDEHGHERR